MEDRSDEILRLRDTAPDLLAALEQMVFFVHLDWISKGVCYMPIHSGICGDPNNHHEDCPIGKAKTAINLAWGE